VGQENGFKLSNATNLQYYEILKLLALLGKNLLLTESENLKR